MRRTFRSWVNTTYYNSYVTTIGIDYGVKKLAIADTMIAVNIFDLSGDDDYKLIRKSYYADAIGLIMVYDVSIKITFDSLTKWEKEATSNGLDLNKCAVVLIGNRSDLKKREVKADMAEDWAKNRGYIFFECSAKNGNNVSEAFKQLFDNIYNKCMENKARYLKWLCCLLLCYLSFHIVLFWYVLL